MTALHPFAQFIRILGRGRHASRSLSQEEAREAMAMILDDEVDPLQLGAFLMLIRVREETPEEVAGFVEAARERIERPAVMPRVDIDWSSYAGKKRQLPWFILATRLLARNGYTLFLHGTSGHTEGRLYTREVLEALGLPVSTSLEEAARRLEEERFAYLDLAHISPGLQRLIDLRPLLGLRSPVHTVARMLNPFGAPCVMQGIFHPGYLEIHQRAGALLNQPHLAVIKGDGGEIERNPDMACPLHTVREGRMEQLELPPIFSKRHIKPQRLDPLHLARVWRGEEEDEYGEGAVIGTTAIALALKDPALTMAEAHEKARRMWEERDRTRL